MSADINPGFSTKSPLTQILRLLGSLLLALLVPGILIYAFGFSMKATAEYTCALRMVERDAQAVAMLGEPLTPGLFAWTPYFESGGGERRGQFSTSVSGPRGHGSIRAQFYRTPLGGMLGVWLKIVGEEYEIYNGTYPCGND